MENGKVWLVRTWLTCRRSRSSWKMSSPLDETIYHYVDTFIDRIRDGIALKGFKAVRENLRLVYVAWRAIVGLMNSIFSIVNNPYVVILVLTLSQWIGRINISLSSSNDPSS